MNDMSGVSAHTQPGDIIDRITKGPAARRLTHRRLDAGQLIRVADEGEADGFLFVRSGCLRSFVSNAGKELTLFVLGPGEAIRVRADTMIEARRDSETVFVPMSALRDIAAADPEFVTWAIPLFDRLLDRSIRLVEDMAFHDVKHRLIRALCDVADREGRRGDLGTVITPSPNADDFATQIGATRQSVSTVMAELIRCGILHRFGQQSMVISDLGRLRQELGARRAS